MKLAKIENGKVINIIVANEVLDGFVVCGDDAAIGYEYNGASFIAPVVIETQKSFEELKAEKLQALIAKRDFAYDAFMGSYDNFEKATFSDRKDEAKAYMLDNTVPTPFINRSLKNGYTEEERVKEINAVYLKALSVSALSGESRDLRNAIEAIVLEDYASEAEAVAALEAIEF